MEHAENAQFIPLLLVFVLAFLVPLIFSRWHWLPVVVGEILAGIVMGKSGFGLITSQDVILKLLGDIGLAFLMFLAGMEIDLGMIFPSNGANVKSDRSGLRLVGLAGAIYLLTLGGAAVGGLALNRLSPSSNPWLLAFVLSATSLGVLLPLLKERGLMHTQYGQAVFLIASLADFVTVVLLTIFLITLREGLSVDVLAIGLLFVAFFLFYRLAIRFTRFQRFQTLIEELSRATVQIKIRGAIAILLSFVVLAQLVQAELILGAFLAGIIISLIKSPQDDDLVHKLEAFGFGFFVPVFFILVGADLDLRLLAASPKGLVFIPVLLVLALIVKLAPALLLRTRFSWKQSLAAGLLLNTHLSLEIAVTVIGARAGLLPPEINAAVVVFAVITVVSMPVLFGQLQPAVQTRIRRLTLIHGINDLSLRVAQDLIPHGEEVQFLTLDPLQVDRAAKAGYAVHQIKPMDKEMADVPFDQARTFITMSASETDNLEMVRSARKHGMDRVLALVADPAHLNAFRDLGATALTPAMGQALVLSLMAHSPETLTLLAGTGQGYEVNEFDLLNPDLIGTQLSQLRLPGDLLVLAIRREGELLVPHGATRLERDDRLSIVGTPESLREAEAWFCESCVDIP